MVELRTRKRELRGDGGNHHEKLGLKRISYAGQFTIPNTTRMNPNPACNNPDRRCSQPNQASHTPYFAYLLVYSESCSSSSPSLSFSSTTLSSSQNTKLSHSSLSLHAMIMSWNLVQHTPSTSIHWVQHTLSTSIHRVQNTPSTASTQDSLSSLQSHDYKLTAGCSFSIRRASLHDRLPSASSPWELKGRVTLSHSHGCELTNWWTESQHLARCQSNPSK